MKVTLPYPVSANRYWATRAWVDRDTKKPRALTYVTDEAKAYKSEVGWLAKQAGARCSDKPIALHVRLVPANGICMDLDNALKVTIDALKGVAYTDDSQVRRIIAERAEADGTARLEVEITEFIPDPAPLFA